MTDYLDYLAIWNIVEEISFTRRLSQYFSKKFTTNCNRKIVPRLNNVETIPELYNGKRYLSFKQL